ncbi:MAG: Bro-N domain-containing protein [bacterium]
MQPQVLTTQKFGDIDIQVIKLAEDPGNLWFTGEDIGTALDLADPRDAVNQIFQRHRDELEEFSSTFKLKVEESSSDTKLVSEAGLRETRIYSEEGLYLITMFARSQKAKEFRRWVVSLVKAYRQGKLGISSAARERRENMREERLILKEQRLFTLALWNRKEFLIL